MIMLTDAAKTAASNVLVQDVAEIVAEGL